MADLTTLSDGELQALSSEVSQEVNRRAIPRQMDSMNRAYLLSSGEAEGQAWRQPTGAHDAYPLGWVVEHDGSQWESTVSGNVWEPGVSGWKPFGTGPLPWVQPTGAHDAYPLGAVVTHKDQTWTSTVDANVWEPGVNGWEVSGGSDAVG